MTAIGLERMPPFYAHFRMGGLVEAILATEMLDVAWIISESKPERPPKSIEEAHSRGIQICVKEKAALSAALSFANRSASRVSFFDRLGKLNRSACGEMAMDMTAIPS